MVVQVLGVTSYEKNGAKNYTLHCLSDFTDYEKDNNAAIGHKVSTVWTNRVDCSGVEVNDIVDLRFEPGFNNQATLSAVDFVRKADNPFEDKQKDNKQVSATSEKK